MMLALPMDNLVSFSPESPMINFLNCLLKYSSIKNLNHSIPVPCGSTTSMPGPCFSVPIGRGNNRILFCVCCSAAVLTASSDFGFPCSKYHICSPPAPYLSNTSNNQPNNCCFSHQA